MSFPTHQPTGPVGGLPLECANEPCTEYISRLVFDDDTDTFWFEMAGTMEKRKKKKKPLPNLVPSATARCFD